MNCSKLDNVSDLFYCVFYQALTINIAHLGTSGGMQFHILSLQLTGLRTEVSKANVPNERSRF